MNPWLTIIGIGDNGLEGLSEKSISKINNAEYVFGGERHLSFIPDNGIKKILWKNPIKNSVDHIMSLKPRPVCVLSSGNPLWHGIGSTLLKYISIDEMLIYPSPSVFSLACAKIGWDSNDVEAVSLHTNPVSFIEKYLQPSVKLFLLTRDSKTPIEVADYLNKRGFNKSKFIIFENLGGVNENITRTTVESFGLKDISRLNVICIECIADTDANYYSCIPGLPNEIFNNDGQITKREIRAATIAKLTPFKDDLLWDIGAGSGSVSIEWMRSSKNLKAIAIECDSHRVEFLKKNAIELGVPNLEIIQGRAPDILAGLKKPNAIFIGGGLSGDNGIAIIEKSINSLLPNGRLVINAVTIETEILLINNYKKYGGDLTRIAVSKIKKVGSSNAWDDYMPVVQWSYHKR
ncbi:MAG: precorrin-6y C5,15-methyltransferase (decarboxylating) subunit CbiE [Alphaproteobacteria bacterium]|jgi:precorrin-6Y C5,15-methyltransferase (decarboxylating)|tara:strand:- start:32143 stop:33357 length:1215 start_codon:yes stop_codon:yes gene_type:complete